MDKIWYRNPSKSEVIGRFGGDEKTEWPRRTDKISNAKKKQKNKKQKQSNLNKLSTLSTIDIYVKLSPR